MITAMQLPWEPDEYKRLLRAANVSSQELARRSSVPITEVDPAPAFASRVPPTYLARMSGRPDDPLLRQVLPSTRELEDREGFVADPLEEAGATAAPGLLQKYDGRALLITTAACPIHCRYCFRREFPYESHPPKAIDQALVAICDDPSISEVILSGGDPLSLNDAPLISLLHRLASVPHVRRLRIHTRFPVVIPQRVTEPLVAGLADLGVPLTLVAHCNHADEIGDDTIIAFQALRAAGITLLNQAVLLAGVNDDANVQVALAEALHDAGVLPYYLHMPDAVRGTQHFQVEQDRALAIMAEVHARLPGYLVPRLVREVPGEAGKRFLF